MRWTKKEIEYLKRNYSANPDMKEMCNKLNKSKRAIQHKALRIGLSRNRHLSRVYPEKTDKRIIDKKYYSKNKKKIYEKKKKRIGDRREKLKNLLGGKCKICGYKKCMGALEFHHHNGDKEGHVSRIIKDSSEQKALKEIKKCILVCANCHRELHDKGQ